MCWSCKHPGNNYSDANPKTVMYEYVILPGEAWKQRQNLEAIKSHYHGQLCPKHLANYEAVVIALEEYEARNPTGQISTLEVEKSVEA